MKRVKTNKAEKRPANRASVHKVVSHARVRFCWLCFKKLYGNHYVEMVVDNHSRILHKQCAKLIEQGR